MRHLRPYFFLFLILSSSSFVQQNEPYYAKWVINKGCSLRVSGKTNVNKFSCDISNYDQPDTLTFFKRNKQGTVPIAGMIKLDLRNFDCHHPVMTNDLRKTLRAKAFPHLTIKFISISKYPEIKSDNGLVTGVVNISLAGQTKNYVIHYTFKNQASNSLTLVGTRKVNFSDFNIIPPRKIGGMIQTEDELDITFNLHIKIIKPSY